MQRLHSFRTIQQMLSMLFYIQKQMLWLAANFIISSTYTREENYKKKKKRTNCKTRGRERLHIGNSAVVAVAASVVYVALALKCTTAALSLHETALRMCVSEVRRRCVACVCMWERDWDRVCSASSAARRLRSFSCFRASDVNGSHFVCALNWK